MYGWSTETLSPGAAPRTRSCRSLRGRLRLKLRVPSDDGVAGPDDRPVAIDLGRIVGKAEGGEHPGQRTGLHLAHGHIHELGKDGDQFARASAAHEIDHLHVPQVSAVLVDVFA